MRKFRCFSAVFGCKKNKRLSNTTEYGITQNEVSTKRTFQRKFILYYIFFLVNISNGRNFAASKGNKEPTTNSPKGEDAIRDKAYFQDKIKNKKNESNRFIKKPFRHRERKYY